MQFDFRLTHFLCHLILINRNLKNGRSGIRLANSISIPTTDYKNVIFN